ncbi:PilE-like protein [Elusimicrobium minutum Pei191]|uniref:PilE-like protein n=1 Tax=Elusimicrobium minutum (strain Pei191) TaxID=445932 RepID=B2KB77_ELUMP|nr:PilE-like protein [Elusimicrobium minutum Pei191]
MKKGFTLIELLVVVLIIGILAAIALPQYNKTVERSRITEALILSRAALNSQQIYKLQTGDYALSWDELDITVPATQFKLAEEYHGAGHYAIMKYYDVFLDKNKSWVASVRRHPNWGRTPLIALSLEDPTKQYCCFYPTGGEDVCKTVADSSKTTTLWGRNCYQIK